MLPLQECIWSLDGLGEWTQIWTHFSGKTSHLGARVGETVQENEIVGSPLIVGSGRSLTQPDEICEWRDRRDSNPKSSDAQSQSEKGIPPLSPEALTQILTHFSGKDRQMLTLIVKRWGSLSDELKRAVLRIIS